MRRAILMVAVALALCVPAAVAQADDSSVYGAYVSRDADFARLGKQYRSGLRAWSRSHERHPQRVLTALLGTITTIDQVTAAITAQQPSSDHGRSGQTDALASVRSLRAWAVTVAKSVTAITNGHAQRGLRLARKSKRLLKQSAAEQVRARHKFKAAGVQIKP